MNIPDSNEMPLDRLIVKETLDRISSSPEFDEGSILRLTELSESEQLNDAEAVLKALAPDEEDHNETVGT